MSWEVPSDRAAQSVADGLLMSSDTVDGCPAAVKASSTAEDTGMCNASVARFEARSRVTVLESTALWWFVKQGDPFLPRFASTRTLPPHAPTNRGQDPRRSPPLVYGLVYKGISALANVSSVLRLSCK